MEPIGLFKLTIAQLEFLFELNITPNHPCFPICHKKFIAEQDVKDPFVDDNPDVLKLEIINSQIPDHKKGLDSICTNQVFKLWKNQQEEMIFEGQRKQAQRWVVINQAFSLGEIYWTYQTKEPLEPYPLMGLDMQIVVNWLANFGDIIMHASGIALDEQGYAFIGKAGSGKSTIVEALSFENGLRVLGEDQIILRYLNGQFWIFGTPWHERPEMCESIGVPLKKLFFLDRSKSETMSSITPFDGALEIMKTAFIPYYRKDRLSRIIDQITLLSQQISFHTLSYKLGSDVFSSILSA